MESKKKRILVEVRHSQGADFDRCFVSEEELENTLRDYLNAGIELVFKPWCWKVAQPRMEEIQNLHNKIHRQVLISKAAMAQEMFTPDELEEYAQKWRKDHEVS
jgi:hypothetical protein